MKWQAVLLALIRCELNVKYGYVIGWQISARGALPIVILAFAVVLCWAGS